MDETAEDYIIFNEDEYGYEDKEVQQNNGIAELRRYLELELKKQ